MALKSQPGRQVRSPGGGRLKNSIDLGGPPAAVVGASSDGRDWIANSPIRTRIAMGSTQRVIPSWTTVSPSTADNTEIAGVMIASP